MDEGALNSPKRSRRRWHAALIASLAAVGLAAGVTASSAFQSNTAIAPANKASASTEGPQHLGFADVVAKVVLAFMMVGVFVWALIV